MGFLIIGVLLLALHFAGIGAPARWNFEAFGDLWKFALPFVLAVVWWSFSDKMGLTQKRAIRQMEQRRTQRREKALAALGIHRARDQSARPAASTPGAAAARAVGSERGDAADLPSKFDLGGAGAGEPPARSEPRL